jgi:hypothetical protein
MKYLDNFNYFISSKESIIKEEIDTKIFESNFTHNHKDVLHTFCSLTHRTYPHGQESKVLKYINHPLKKDEHNNYYLKIGNSNTMFASHLDSATTKYTDVKLLTYIKENNRFISTDGKTILGADDKAGVTIMLYMIEHKIPGLYYFFIGEEMGGIGSNDLSRDKDNPLLKNIKRCISFDRNGYNSIITHQMMHPCCSEEFADKLCEEFNKQGLELSKDETGIFTDSANFVNSISECTNISVGYFKEHTKQEIQNITYLERLCNACIKIDWENLPVSRNRYKQVLEKSNTETSLYSLINKTKNTNINTLIKENTNLKISTSHNKYDNQMYTYAYDVNNKLCYCIEKVNNNLCVIEVPYSQFISENGELKDL